MDYYSSQISKLIEEFSRLPGVGPHQHCGNDAGAAGAQAEKAARSDEKANRA